MFDLSNLYTGSSQFLLPQKEEERKQQGLKMGKRESYKSEWDTGVSDPWAFKLDHLQPVKQILLQKISPFYPASHNKPFLITPERGRKAENWKRELPKSEWETGVSDPCAFKLHHLQPVKQIMLQKLFTISVPVLPEKTRLPFRRVGFRRHLSTNSQWWHCLVFCVVALVCCHNGGYHRSVSFSRLRHQLSSPHSPHVEHLLAFE